MDSSQNPKILFFGESATLAHVARPFVLANSLDPSRYQIHFACSEHYEFILRDSNLKREPLESRSPQEFMQILDRGGCLFEADLVRRYVAEELKLIERIKPQILIGDMRPTLAISSELSGIPYLSIFNVDWSPFALNRRYPPACLERVRKLGLSGISGKVMLSLLEVFNLVALPSILREQGAGLNAVRKEYGLKEIPDYIELLSKSDWTLYPDIPLVAPCKALPDTHRYLGPLTWSPAVKLPRWWNELSPTKDLIYVSLGSSGISDLLPHIISGLQWFEGYIVITTGGKTNLNLPPHPGLKVVDFMPGEVAASRSIFVIASGGSQTAYQALGCGAPVLGIASNMDQLLFSANIERLGAGLQLRADILSARDISKACQRIITETSFKTQALKAQQQIKEYNSTQILTEILDQILLQGRNYERVHNM